MLREPFGTTCGVAVISDLVKLTHPRPPPTPTIQPAFASYHPSSGWRDYCMNRVHVDSARPMFRKESNTRLRSSE